MEFKPFKEDLSEICTKEEIEEFNSMMKVCKVDPNKLLDGINARKFAELYVKVYLCAKLYGKAQSRYKINNIDNEQELSPEVKDEYEDICNKSRQFMYIHRLLDKVASVHSLGKYTLGGKSVLQATQELAKLTYANERGTRHKEKIEYILKYIDESDKALGLYEEKYGDE